MSDIVVPEIGGPEESFGADSLIGVDGNAYSIIGHVKKLLRHANASEEYIDSYFSEATSGDYDHLLQASIAYLEGPQ